MAIILGIISEGFGDVFEGDFADMGTNKFPLMSMGGRAEGLAARECGPSSL